MDYGLSEDDIIMKEAQHSDEEPCRTASQLSESIEALIRDQSREHWDASRWRFLACVFETYTRCVGTLVVIYQQMSSEMSRREASVKAREERLEGVEEQLQKYESLRAWEDRLREEQARLNAQRREFEEETVQSLQEIFRRFTAWEAEFSAAMGLPGGGPAP